MRGARPKVIDNLGLTELAFMTFRRLLDREVAERVFAILQDSPIGAPTRINDDFAFSRANLLSQWQAGPIDLKWAGDEVGGIFTLQNEEDRKLSPSHIFLAFSSSHFRKTEQLDGLIDFGTALYHAFSASCGFVFLPWMPKVGALMLITRGLPGFGWATWLGPEYDALLQPPEHQDIRVESLSDGGRLIVLPKPTKVDEPDRRCLEAQKFLIDSSPPEVLQIGETQAYDLSGLRGVALDAALRESHREIFESVVAEKRRKVKLPKFRFR